MEAQVLKSLVKLRKITTRSHKELRDVIDAAQAAMTAAVERKSKPETGGGGSGGGAAATSGGGIGGANEVPFEPFLLACLTRHAKLVAVALDCIEKFLAFGFLRGNGVIPDGIRKRLVQKGAGGSNSSNSNSGARGGGGDSDTLDGSGGGASSLNEENWKLIDCIVDVICECGDHPDETVQIQVLRVLLTAVTTTTCEVHEHSLLKAVRACYHIHLVSKSATNQTVAKATLQQIISIVFQRMETFDQRVAEETEATLKESLQKSEAAAAAAAAATADASDFIAAPTAAWYPSVVRVLHLDAPQQQSQQLNGAARIPGLASHATGSSAPVFAPSFPSVLHKDAFLLFRSLCRISMRSVAEDSALGSSGGLLSGGSGSSSVPGASNGSSGSEDPFAFQSKILSLELVLAIINNAGPSFRRGERFIHAIRQYLCQSLLQNCTSNYTQIVGLSLQVFLVLLGGGLKRHLKAEIEIFVTSIFLKILQSENSSFEHKMLVLEVLNTICDDAQVLGEIFLNYDCDWNTNDLFKQIIDALAKTAKGKKDPAAYYASLSSALRLKAQQNDAALVLKGLECMTATVASLKKAANFLEAEKKNSNLRTNSGSNHSSGADGDDDTTSAAPAVVMTPLVAATSSTPSAAPSTMSAVEAFDRKKKRQEEFATGILKFNVKPTAGVQYLIQHGHMGEGTPRDVARFFMDHNGKLDKTMVGDYLGRESQYQNGFCVKVLHEYVDMMDFSNMEIDVAIRLFLSGFRLPGESQKIDRMMEKFAERFYSACAPGLFPSADTAFILSFSIIMLQTDLHNPNVAEEKKMTREGFLRNNRGINNGEDLPDEYLGGIFDRIKQTPISLKEDEDFKARRKVGGGVKAVAATTLFGASGATVDRQRRDAYIKERESMVRQSEALFKRRNPASIGASVRGLPISPRSGAALASGSGIGGSGGSQPAPQFHVVSELTENSHVRPMFETVWAPLLACCSVIFESSDSPVAIQLCLNSFKHAIHLAARLHMPAERDAFVTVLAKFTALHNTGSRLLRSKHIEAIKALISISVKEGNYLGDAWRDILQCISQLARIQTHAQGLHSDTQFFNQQQQQQNHRQASPASSTMSNSSGGAGAFATTPTHSSSSSLSLGLSKRTHSSATSTFPSPSHRDATNSSGGSGTGTPGGDQDQYNQAIEDENAARVVAEIDSLASDRVFSSSVSLTDTAVQEFVLQLCVVSLTECSGVSTGRSSRLDAPFSPPRVFSLQKLVEVADMNMHTRSRVVWASTWKVLSRHFTTIGCHDNLSIAMYAIDSLRQLSMRFLEREELKDFNFQRLFLAPFEVIMANAVSMEIRELVLRCVEHMVLARVANIKSGWKTIWGVLRVAAETYEPGNSEQQDRIVQLGFAIAKRIFDNHFDRIVEVFVDAVECLLAFAVCGAEDVEKSMDEHMGLTQLSIDSIAILQHVCMAKLATGQVIEKLFVDASAPKRVGFRAKKRAASVSLSGDEGAASPTAASGANARGGGPVRYERQESSKTLEEEIAVFSPPQSPKRRASTVASPPPAPPASDSVGVYNDSAAHTRMWWPVLTALSTLGADCRLDVRLAALHGLFDSLEAHGSKFSTGLWSLVFKGVLIPLLDELRHLEGFVDRGRRVKPKLPLPAHSPSRIQYSAGKTTSTFCLERLLECFGLFYDTVGFLPEVLFLLGKCMDTSDAEEELAAASAASLEKMLVAHGHKFPDDVWGLIADELRSVMARAEPTWIFFSMPPPTASTVTTPPMSPVSALASPPTSPISPFAPPRVPSIISMYPAVVRVLRFAFPRHLPPKVVTADDVSAQQFPSTTHLRVILALQHVMGNVLASRFRRRLALRDGHVANLLACLRESFVFARKVNDALPLRAHLQRAGWTYDCSDVTDIPSLLLQEVQGKEQYLRVLCHAIREPPGVVTDRQRDDARRQMTQLVKQSVEEYITWTTPDWDDNDSNSSNRFGIETPADARQRTVRYVALLIAILHELAEFDGAEIQRHLAWLYPLLNELIKTPSADVRAALMLVYSRSISQLLPLPAQR